MYNNRKKDGFTDKEISDALYNGEELSFDYIDDNNFLREDNYIIRNKINDEWVSILTHKGKLFIEKGGYKKDLIRTNNIDFNQKARNLIVSSGSILAGLYSLWKLYSHFDKIFSINLLTFLFLLLSGVLIGVVITILLRPK